jgi:hypothetical protein
MASQGSDKLKAILADARAKADAARAAGGPERTPAETRRIEALLDRNEALPDPRALARMYQSKELVEKLPDDEESAPNAPSTAPDAASPAPRPVTVEAPAEATPDRRGTEEAAYARPPLSPAQIREVMNELKEQFTGGSYVTYEAKALPEDVIPMPEEETDETVPIEEPNELFYIAGAVIAMVVIGIFVVLALNGPLRYQPPPGGSSPSPAASAHR